jgi:hypothetical protein
MDMHKIIDLIVAGDESVRQVFSDELAKQIQTMAEQPAVVPPTDPEPKNSDEQN